MYKDRTRMVRSKEMEVFYYKAFMQLLLQKRWWGTAPRKVRGVGEHKVVKQAGSGYGGRCSRISRGTPEARSRLCVCRASFLMTFAMGGVPHSGPQQKIFTFLQEPHTSRRNHKTCLKWSRYKSWTQRWKVSTFAMEVKRSFFEVKMEHTERSHASRAFEKP